MSEYNHNTLSLTNNDYLYELQVQNNRNRKKISFINCFKFSPLAYYSVKIVEFFVSIFLNIWHYFVFLVKLNTTITYYNTAYLRYIIITHLNKSFFFLNMVINFPKKLFNTVFTSKRNKEIDLKLLIFLLFFLK